jgi:2-polyprenyl-3-methyl-5-hydroxy-6-metoxy-1,4-benzoquinol methylase
MNADPKNHWEKVYRSKAPDAVSWYRAHLERSIELIRRVAADPLSAIIDVGGGESTLVDDLLGLGYRDVSVLDISETAIEVARKRIGAPALMIQWIAGDVTRVTLDEQRYEVWHDRAVFHFLTDAESRAAYVAQVARAVKRGGHVLIATFGPEGPDKCSGLDVVRYDTDSLHDQFGARFRLEESATELHTAPFGTTQQFLYCLCKVT